MKKFLIILIIFVVIFTILCIHSHLSIDVTHYIIKSSKIPKEFNDYKILHLSDLHNRNLEEEILKIINEENIDIVLMSGDMIDDKSKDIYSNFLSLCSKINIPSYYVYGNHEENLSKEILNEILNKLNSTSTKFLNNEKIVLNKENSFINLYGLSYPLEYYSKFKKNELPLEYINQNIGKINQTSYNILLTHNPIFAETYKEYGADIVFTGHIHGGVIKIPLIGGLLSPDFTLFPKYYEGNYKMDNTNLIVSRGLGYGSLKIRVLNPAQLVIVVLKNE